MATFFFYHTANTKKRNSPRFYSTVEFSSLELLIIFLSSSLHTAPLIYGHYFPESTKVTRGEKVVRSKFTKTPSNKKLTPLTKEKKKNLRSLTPQSKLPINFGEKPAWSVRPSVHPLWGTKVNAGEVKKLHTPKKLIPPAYPAWRRQNKSVKEAGSEVEGEKKKKLDPKKEERVHSTHTSEWGGAFWRPLLEGRRVLFFSESSPPTKA